MANQATVENLKRHFETIINRTFLAYDLRNCYDAVDKEVLRSIEQDVRYMERAMTELKKVNKDRSIEVAFEVVESHLGIRTHISPGDREWKARTG